MGVGIETSRGPEIPYSASGFSVWSHSAKGLLTMRPCDHLGAHGALIPVGGIDGTVGCLDGTVGSLEGLVRRRSIRFLSSLSEAPFESPFAALVILNALASGRHKGMGKLEHGLGPWGCCERAVCVLGPKSAPELTCDAVQGRPAPTVLILTCGSAAARFPSKDNSLGCSSKPQLGPANVLMYCLVERITAEPIPVCNGIPVSRIRAAPVGRSLQAPSVQDRIIGGVGQASKNELSWSWIGPLLMPRRGLLKLRRGPEEFDS